MIRWTACVIDPEHQDTVRTFPFRCRIELSSPCQDPGCGAIEKAEAEKRATKDEYEVEEAETEEKEAAEAEVDISNVEDYSDSEYE